MSNEVVFRGTTYTQPVLKGLTSKGLVDLYNRVASATGAGQVVRFSDRATGVKRTWKALQDYAAQSKETAKVRVKKGKGNGEAKAKRAPRGTDLAPPGHAPVACREGSKQAILVDMLSRPEGATMPQLLNALKGGRQPWQEVTVRSAFGWDMKLKGYGVKSTVDERGVERFHLVVPKGHRIPAHRPLKGAGKE